MGPLGAAAPKTAVRRQGEPMENFVEALRMLQPEDMLRLLLVLGPVALSIWAIVNWAYKVRLANLEKSIELLRADRDIEIQRMCEQLQREHDKEIDVLQHEFHDARSQLELTYAKLNEVRSDFAAFHELAENYQTHKDALWHWWQKFDKKYFKVRDRRHKELMRSGGESYEHRDPVLLDAWKKEKDSPDNQSGV